MNEKDQLTTHDEALSLELREMALQIVPDPTFAQQLEVKLTQSSHGHPPNTVRFFHVGWRGAAAAILIIFVAFATITPLRTWAQAVVNGFFERIASNQERIIYNEVDIDSLPRVTTLEAANALEDQFGFDVLLPTAGLEGADFEGGFYNTVHPYLSMGFRTREAFIVIYQMQEQQSEIESWRQVGASAEVLDTTITRAEGEIYAQYVQGSWGYRLQAGMPTLAPGQGIDTIMTWDSTIPMTRLRWQDGEIIYEVSATAVEGLTRLPITIEDLIVIAEGLR